MKQYNFEILRFLRKQAGLTIEALAKKSGVSYAVISKLERNQTNPALGTLRFLAQALGISATELVAMAEIRTSDIRKEAIYTIDGFHFRKTEFNNAAILYVTGRKGERLSRPEIHENDNEAVYVQTGSIHLKSSMGDFTLAAGQAIQFDAVFSHTYEVLEDCEMIILHIRKRKRF